MVFKKWGDEMMDIWEAMSSRHSVRSYLNRPLETEKVSELQNTVDGINAETGFHFVLCLDEPEAFQANKPHYGSFNGCRNYFALIAPKGEDERVGYYGERLVLLAQQLGLNTCWVAVSYKKGKVTAPVYTGEKIHALVALGYGKTQGVPHKSKNVSKLAKMTIDTPKWFETGMDAVMLAPTAINQQRFWFEQIGERGVKAKALLGPCSKVDLGIVKYHFELGAGKENFDWV